MGNSQYSTPQPLSSDPGNNAFLENALPEIYAKKCTSDVDRDDQYHCHSIREAFVKYILNETGEKDTLWSVDYHIEKLYRDNDMGLLDTRITVNNAKKGFSKIDFDHIKTVLFE